MASMYVLPLFVYCLCSCFFFFNDTATTEIYTLSLHDALPICRKCPHKVHRMEMKTAISCTILRHTKILIAVGVCLRDRKSGSAGMPRPISYAVFCLKKKKNYNKKIHNYVRKMCTLQNVDFCNK